MTNCASAYSTANRAGWARSVGSRPGPVEHLGLQVDAEFLGESGGAPVEVLPEHRLGVVETTGHADVLRALTGKQERHPICAWRNALRAPPDRDVVVLGGGQHSGGIGTVGNDGCHPDLVSPPTRKGERHVGQQQVFVAREFRGERSPGILQGLGGAGGQQQHLRTARGFRDGGEGLRRLLDDDVHVGATDTE